jgi:hypothetical protein
MNNKRKLNTEYVVGPAKKIKESTKRYCYNRSSKELNSKEPTDKECYTIIEELKFNDSLEEVVLICCKINVKLSKMLVEIFKTHQIINKLVFLCSHVTNNEALKILVEAFKHIPLLESLSTYESNFCKDSEKCTILAEGLNVCNIKFLNIGKCGLDDEGCKIIAEVLKNKSSLISFSFHFSNKVGNVGCIVFANALKSHIHLEYITMAGCRNIDNEGYLFLAETLKQLPSFRSIFMNTWYRTQERPNKQIPLTTGLIAIEGLIGVKLRY